MNPLPSLPEQRRGIKDLYSSKSSHVQLVDLSSAPHSEVYHAVVKERLQFSVPFEQEVNIHSTLTHESIYFPKLLAYDLKKKLMMLEYCETGNLAEVIQSQAYTWEVDSAYHFMLQLVEAVRIMHKRGIVHGDIQPYHVLLETRMNPKLTGFGKAKFIRGPVDGNEFKDDIFNLGKTLFAWLTGDLSQEPKVALVPKLLRKYPEVMVVCIQYMITRRSAQEIIVLLTSETIQGISFQTVTAEGMEEAKRDLPGLMSMSYNGTQVGLSMDTGGTSFDPREISLNQELQPQSATAQHVDRSRASTVPPTFSVGQITGVIIAKTSDQPFPQEILVTELQKLAAIHKQLRGSFKISLKKSSELCSGQCERRFLSLDLIHLECGEAFCRSCMTQILTQAISDKHKYSNIKCPVCQTRFDPLDDAIAEYLEERLQVDLTELKLGEEAVRCPNLKCGCWLDIEPSVMPLNQKCPSCGTSFCTYCFGKRHYFSCSRYRNSLKRRLTS